MLHPLTQESVETHDLFTPFDLQCARFICSLGSCPSVELFCAAALASSAVQRGNTCIDLGTCADMPLGSPFVRSMGPICPTLDMWKKALLDSAIVGTNDQALPLILDGDLLYLHRFFHDEKSLAGNLIALATGTLDTDASILRTLIDSLFEKNDERCDSQKLAVCVAAYKRLCIISGGPGTGKTTTAAKILEVINRLPSPVPLRVALCAPTGKASARLKSALVRQNPEFANYAALTLHRLLGAQGSTRKFRFGPENLLPYDIILIDEASMIDCSLMARLLGALPRDARLILLGDKDQLVSVEAGSIMKDICAPFNEQGYSPDLCTFTGVACGLSLKKTDIPQPSQLSDTIVNLTHNFRFGKQSGIAAFSNAVISGNAEQALHILDSREFPDIDRIDPLNREGFLALQPQLIKWFSDYSTSKVQGEMTVAFDRLRMLCAVKHGPYGTNRINEWADGFLRAGDNIDGWYHGKPVMLSANNYDWQLFNGDTGIVCKDTQSQSGFTAHFSNSADGSVSVDPAIIGSLETAYAITIHKSQGSEFDTVWIFLPDETSQILSRELLYTAVTRARTRVRLFATVDAVTAAIMQPVVRTSGLKKRLTD